MDLEYAVQNQFSYLAVATKSLVFPDDSFHKKFQCHFITPILKRSCTFEKKRGGKEVCKLEGMSLWVLPLALM